jgi:hypothetical protein
MLLIYKLISQTARLVYTRTSKNNRIVLINFENIFFSLVPAAFAIFSNHESTLGPHGG